jgi:glyoxylase-like metal-dependent hydrolase (beta-lactamase superfamily II)
MRLASGIEMLEVSAVIMGKVDVIYPTLVWDDNTAILVDTGYPGQMVLIREAIEKAGVPFTKLTHIILTHQDIDHIGCLPALLNESSQSVEVLATEVEKPYIQGEKRLLKISLEAIERAVQSLPPEVPEAMRKAFRAALENPPKGPVDKTIADGENLPYCGGMTVINTPGHTPGHICLYHHPSKTLIAGDAMRVIDRQLLGPDPHATLDMTEAIKSLKKLLAYDIENVICYHGGLYKKNVNQQIAELVK